MIGDRSSPPMEGMTLQNEGDMYATSAGARPDLARGASSMSSSTASFLSDNGMLPNIAQNGSSLGGRGLAHAGGRMHPPTVDTSSCTMREGHINEGLPITPLVGKQALQQKKHYTLPPPLRQPSLTTGGAAKQIDVTPLQSSHRKKHFEPGATPVPPPLNVRRKPRK